MDIKKKKKKKMRLPLEGLQANQYPNLMCMNKLTTHKIPNKHCGNTLTACILLKGTTFQRADFITLQLLMFVTAEKDE